MLGLWLEDRTLALRRDMRPPTAPDGEAVVAVRLAGVCRTDLEMVKGYYPFRGVPGHEFVGEVVESSERAWLGRRVVGEINATCSSCEMCRRGLKTHCENRTVVGLIGRNGTMAERVALPVANLHVVPANIGDEAAVFTEPLAAALHVSDQVAIRADDRVIVIGDGKLGLLVALGLRARGVTPTLIGRHAERLGIAERAGAACGFEDALPSKRADVVVECTGNPDGLRLALGAVRPRGTVVLKSTYHGVATLAFAPLVVDEVTLVGSRCGPFEPALDLLAAGRIDVAPLLEARYPLAAGLAAFEHASRPGALKVVVDASTGGAE